MKIIADENIAQVEVFKSLGDLQTLPGREINADIVKNADALLVRSITNVNQSLLQNSSVKFVASATSGFDHVDCRYLQKQNIQFNYAPGCNARSVVEYVFSAVAYVLQHKNHDWRKHSFGIIGAGNIGGLLAKYLRNLGINYSIYDPLLDPSSEHSNRLVSFEEVLQQDILSIHTPLTFDGKFPSFHLFDKKIIDGLAPGKVLINAARGAVVDNESLLARLNNKADLICVLDAWENEPSVKLKLLEKVDIGTPHIAGYSLDGKLKGSEVLYEEICNFFALEKKAQENFRVENYPSSSKVIKAVTPTGEHWDLISLNRFLVTAYDIKQDHNDMQALLKNAEPARLFDQLRKNYPLRFEYSFGESLLAY